MKIVYLSDSYLPSAAANAIHVVKMCEAFSDLGHEVTLCCHRLSGGKDMPDIFSFYGVKKNFEIVFTPTFSVLKGGKRFAGLYKALYARYWRPDLVYGRCFNACYFSSLIGMPTIYECHKGFETFGALSQKMLKHLLRQKMFQRLVVISSALKENLEKHLGEHSKTMVAPSGASFFEVALREVKDRFVVGYVGSGFPGKGIEFISQLSERLSDVTFKVAGVVPTMRSCAQNIMCVEKLPPAQANSFLNETDVAIAPYGRKVFDVSGVEISAWMSPLKIFEYMAAGKAIIASQLPVLREILRDGENCLLCEPDNLDSWSQAIRRLQADSALQEKLSRNARRDFEKYFSLHERAQKVLS